MPSAFDQIVDIISHFIGEMRIQLEDMRARTTPEEGPGIPQKAAPLSLHPEAAPPVKGMDLPMTPVAGAGYDIAAVAQEFEPGFEPDEHVPAKHLEVELRPDDDPAPPDMVAGKISGHHYIIPPPADFIAVVQQQSFLFDQDIVVVGHPSFAIPLPSQPVFELRALELEARETANGFSTLEPVFAHDHLSGFVVETYEAVSNAEAPTASGETLSGQWLNGELIEDKAPELDDYLPDGLSLAEIKNPDLVDEDETVPTAPSQSLEIDASKADTTMDVSSGSNLVVNEAQLITAGVTATTIAVSGDNYCLDVIVQVNAISSCADVETDLPASISFSSADDILLNLASFETITKSADEAAAKGGSGQMSDAWAVTIVDSDLISFNWLYQYNFIADGDSLVLTATGTTTTIGTGGNITMNATGITYMGMTYDLMLIGGNLYDVNYISQLNVLYDHDTIATYGDMADNAGTITSGGNLLWNQAQILRIGPSEWQSGVPDHYNNVMDRLDNGNTAMPQSLAKDGGSGPLKVLYVKGDMYDINYVEQVNVAGDPDKVILYAEQTFDKAVDWTVETGGNVLINAAAIVDYQSVGDAAYLGGTLYSQAMLIQSEIIHAGKEAPAPMVSEAIAFIADDFDVGDVPDIDTLGLASLANQAPDGLDAVLA